MHRSRPILIGFVLLIVLVLAGVIGGLWLVVAHNAGNSSLGSASPTASTPFNPGGQPGTGSSKVNAIVAQVLDNMHLHAWNPQAMTRGQVTGGLFINWQMTNPAVTNVTRPGVDGTTIHDHDPQVDLLYLTDLAERQQINPGNHTYDADLSHATALVLADFQRYSVPKGWIYFYLLHDGLLLHNADLVNEALGVAQNFFNMWYDPALGTVYDRAHTPGTYSTEHTITCGAALIDAGMRWQHHDWVDAGEKTIDHTIAVTYNQSYHLFYDSMIIQDGQDQIQSYKSRPSTDGDVVDALLTAYQLTHRQQYLDISTQVFQSLFTTSGLWDTSRGGFYFTLELNDEKLVTAYKETRSQTLVLIALHHYNQVSPHPLMQQEQQLVSVITDHFYQSTNHGFVYRLTVDFHIYVSKPGAGPGVEDYFTTEAMGSALDSLQQTELAAQAW